MRRRGDLEKNLSKIKINYNRVKYGHNSLLLHITASRIHASCICRPRKPAVRIPAIFQILIYIIICVIVFFLSMSIQVPKAETRKNTILINGFFFSLSHLVVCRNLNRSLFPFFFPVPPCSIKTATLPNTTAAALDTSRRRARARARTIAQCVAKLGGEKSRTEEINVGRVLCSRNNIKSRRRLPSNSTYERCIRARLFYIL